MIILVSGCRTLKDYSLVKNRIDAYRQTLKGEPVTIIHGGQVSVDKETGEVYSADYFASVYAEENGLEQKKFLADWAKYGKAAGPIRNKQMASYLRASLNTGKYAIVMAFWDGLSRGTRDMIQLSAEYDITCYITHIS